MKKEKIIIGIVGTLAIVGAFLVMMDTLSGSDESSLNEAIINRQIFEECIKKDFPYYWDNGKQECAYALDDNGCYELYDYDREEVIELPKTIEGNHEIRMFCNDHTFTYDKTECWNHDGFGYWIITCIGEDETCRLCW